MAPTSSSSKCMTQKCLYTFIWLTWLVTILLSITYGTMSVLMLQGLYEWMYNAGINSVIEIASKISGVTGSCAVLLVMLGIYIIVSLVVLIGKLFKKKDSFDFQYGFLVGVTFSLIFVCLQTALVVQASQYLVAGKGEINFETDVPQISDESLFRATTIVGYVTSFVYFLLFLFLTSYHCAVSCGCCLDNPPPVAKAASKDSTAPSPTASTSSRTSSKISAKSKPSSKV